MRLILVGLFLLLFYVFSLPMFLVAYILGRKEEEKRTRFAQVLVVAAFKVILFISGVKVTVKGKENILHNQAALYTFNHRSFFDIVVGYTTGPMNMGFVAKKEMDHLPLVTRWMRYMNCIFLDRDNIKEGLKTILQGIDLLKNGHSLYIAPEGTRNYEKDMLPFHEASFKLAEKSKCPIVPVAMSNNDAIFENHLPWIRKGHVVIEYCTPIYMNDMSRDEKKHIGETVRGIIQDTLDRNEVLIQDMPNIISEAH